MKIGKLEINFRKSESKNSQPEIQSNSDSLLEVGGNGYGGAYWPILTKKWDGEKTPGELGVVIKNIPLFQSLRLRGYDAFTKTDTVKIFCQRRFQWVIGSGLKLEAEPNRTVLSSEGIEELPRDFQRLIEERWKVYTNSVYCDYEKRRNLHGLAMDFYTDKFTGGDCLVVCRIESIGVTVQFISGEHVKSPMLGDEVLKNKVENNYIEHGIEFNQRGEHIAYYVYAKSNDGNLLGKFERIEAYGTKTKRRLAWIVYGQKLSPDHKRGVPEFAQILEKVAKLDRYTEASVSKAEQAANILFAITHKEFSTGENPLDGLVKKKLKINGIGGDSELDGYALGDGLANRIIEGTSNQTFNLPPGAEMNSFGTDIESNYQEFHSANFKTMAASIGTPPEVAMQEYNSNYSASRAAINGWGYVVSIDRQDFANQFYRPFYKLWLEFEVLSNKIQAPGLIIALQQNNYMVIEAYTSCRFTGKNMPHIDPLKEIKAIREMLGDVSVGKTPLISHEQATEMANAGDFEENYNEYREEKNTLIIDETIKPETNVS